MAKAEPRYKLPLRQTFSAKIIPDMYEAVMAKLNTISEGEPFLSFTSDGWSDTASGAALLSLTVHWLDEQFERRHAVIGAIPLEGSHTGEYLAEKLQEMKLQFEIDPSRVHLKVRNSGANSWRNWIR